MIQLKRKLSRSIVYLLLVISVPVGILLAGYWVLPVYIESKLIPKLFEKIGISPLECRIRRLDFSGLDAGPIRFGNEKDTALLIRTLQIDYAFKELLQKRVKNVRFTGVTLRCAFEDGLLTFPGLYLTPILANLKQAPDPQQAHETGPLEMMPDRIEVRSGTLILEFKQLDYRIPFELVIKPGNDGLLKGMLWIYPRGQKLAITADLFLEPNTARLTLVSDSIQLHRFSDLTAWLPDLHLSGEIDIKADAGISLSPFSLNFLDAVLSWKNASVDYNAIQMRPGGALDQIGEPLTIHLKGGKSGIWHLESTAFSFTSPLPLALSDLHLDINTNEKATRATGRARLGLKKSPPEFSGPISIQKDTDTALHFSASITETGKWIAEISNKVQNKSATEIEKCHLKMNGANFFSETPVVFISASGEGQKGVARLEATTHNILLENGETNLKIPLFRTIGDVMIDGDRVMAKFKMTLPDTRIDSDSMLATIPHVSFSGDIQKSKHHSPRFNGFFEFSKMSLVDTASLIKIEGAGCSVPVRWPESTPGKSGNFAIDRFWFSDHLLGSINGTLRQKNMGVLFSGTHDNTLLPGLKALFSGKILKQADGRQTAELSFEIPTLTLESGVDLEQFFPAAKGITFTGTLSARGGIKTENSNLEGVAEVRIDGGAVMLEEYNMSIEGIETIVQLPDLIHFRSRPDQRICFKKAAFGTIAMTSGKIHFQIESPTSFFIEKSSFNWCNGNVDTQSFRIIPDSDDYSLTLYCSRLDLAMMLGQLGDMNAEGKGTVNGKIPLDVRNGKIKIVDGFLNSVPGDGGSIRLKGTETLAKGLLTDSPQFGQLELALEALKDYEYKWAKLELNSEEDTLLMRLQFDGKPARPLPFEFSPELGGFARIESGKAGSLFQGISLDINLKLPLNEILRYKGVLNMIQ